MGENKIMEESGAKQLKRGIIKVVVMLIINTILCALAVVFAKDSIYQGIFFPAAMWVIVIIFTARNIYKGRKDIKRLWEMENILKTQGEAALKEAIKKYLEDENKK